MIVNDRITDYIKSLETDRSPLLSKIGKKGKAGRRPGYQGRDRCLPSDYDSCHEAKGYFRGGNCGRLFHPFNGRGHAS